MSDREQFLRQVERLAESHVLHGSESLCKLLRYLAHHALEHPGTPLKEYQIATEEFGRPSDFDPAVDSMVRVQAGRLRSKLVEYYAVKARKTLYGLICPKAHTPSPFISAMAPRDPMTTMAWRPTTTQAWRIPLCLASGPSA